jgi:hypothetical protein
VKGRSFAFWVAASILVASAALATDWRDGALQQAPPHGPLTVLWDGSVMRGWRSSSDGYAYVLDRNADNWQVTTAILNNAPVNHKYASAVLDLRQMGGLKSLMLKAPGSVSLYIGVEGMYSATYDSNSVFPFALGGSRPSGSGGAQGPGYFLTVNKAVPSDSTLSAATRRMIPLVDSTSKASFTAPYGRVLVWADSTASVSGIYLTLVGKPQ